MPVSCYPGSLFLVFFLLVGVLWDTPGTGVSSSQWSTSPVCLFFYSFSSLVTASLPVWEGWGPYLPRLGGNKGVLSSSRSSVLTSSPCRGGIHPWLPTDPHKSPGSPENSHAESSAAAGPCPGLSSLLGSGSLPAGGRGICRASSASGVRLLIGQAVSVCMFLRVHLREGKRSQKPVFWSGQVCFGVPGPRQRAE